MNCETVGDLIAMLSQYPQDTPLFAALGRGKANRRVRHHMGERWPGNGTLKPAMTGVFLVIAAKGEGKDLREI